MLRTADAKLFEMQAVAHLDQQLLEKDEVHAEQKLFDEMHCQLSNNLYMERLNREKREIAERQKRNEMTRACIESQVELRQAYEHKQKEAQAIEDAEVVRLCKQHVEEEKTAAYRRIVAARAARVEVDTLQEFSACLLKNQKLK